MLKIIQVIEILEWNNYKTSSLKEFEKSSCYLVPFIEEEKVF